MYVIGNAASHACVRSLIDLVAHSGVDPNEWTEMFRTEIVGPVLDGYSKTKISKGMPR